MQLLKFHKTHCAPCNLVNTYFKNVGVEPLSVNVEENPEMTLEWDIRSAPTVVLLDDEGKEVRRVSGFNQAVLSEMVAALG